MKTYVEVTVSVPGMHRWSDAPDSVAFLRTPHRHLLEIKAGKSVSSNDREVEFYLFQNEVLDAIDKLYQKTEIGIYDFAERSCESIAKDILLELRLSYCAVSEDGENRSIVVEEY